MHIVKHAAYLGQYRIAVTFEDEVVKIVDMKGHLDGEVFEPLKAVELFRRFTVNPDTDTLEWPNGADVSPDWLYETGVDASTVAMSVRAEALR
jgi:hypothetical protein